MIKSVTFADGNLTLIMEFPYLGKLTVSFRVTPELFDKMRRWFEKT